MIREIIKAKQRFDWNRKSRRIDYSKGLSTEYSK